MCRTPNSRAQYESQKCTVPFCFLCFLTGVGGDTFTMLLGCVVMHGRIFQLPFLEDAPAIVSQLRRRLSPQHDHHAQHAYQRLTLESLPLLFPPPR